MILVFLFLMARTKEIIWKSSYLTCRHKDSGWWMVQQTRDSIVVVCKIFIKIKFRVWELSKSLLRIPFILNNKEAILIISNSRRFPQPIFSVIPIPCKYLILTIINSIFHTKWIILGWTEWDRMVGVDLNKQAWLDFKTKQTPKAMFNNKKD